MDILSWINYFNLHIYPLCSYIYIFSTKSWRGTEMQGHGHSWNLQVDWGGASPDASYEFIAPSSGDNCCLHYVLLPIVLATKEQGQQSWNTHTGNTKKSMHPFVIDSVSYFRTSTVTTVPLLPLVLLAMPFKLTQRGSLFTKVGTICWNLSTKKKKFWCCIVSLRLSQPVVMAQFIQIQNNDL